MNCLILLPIALPIILGFGLLLLPERVFPNRKVLIIVTGVSFILCALSAVFVISGAAGTRLVLTRLVDDISIFFQMDGLGRLFAGLVTLIFVLAGFFSLCYMQHEKNEKRYYSYYLITFGVLMGLCLAGNMATLYLFYELMTLASMPLVLHTGTKEAVMAGLKYLFYSFCGAYMALFGIYFLYHYAGTLDFAEGGLSALKSMAQSGNTGFLLVAAFLMIVGFGVKAGCFPLHAWLPTAHPVAPAPASAFLSGIIVKGGVLAIIRTVYYCFGAELLRGTWVQTVWVSLAVLTLLMGSSLAFKEKVLKKRFAYSTVSNLSYILLGLAMLNTTAFVGSLLHVVFHAIIKTALFLFAGALIFHTGRTRVNDFVGLAGRMPVLYWCYTIVSLGLIGIPPMSGLVSKWYLMTGCLDGGLPSLSCPWLSWLGAAALLISALLTAGYLLPISIKGFLYAPVDSSLIEKYHEPSPLMLVPMALLAALTIIFGLYPAPLINWISGICAGLF